MSPNGDSMSHIYDTIPRSEDLPPLPAGIEVVIARTWATDAEKSKRCARTPQFDDQTVLVLLGPNAQSRRAARSHAARYMHAEIGIHQVPCDVAVDTWIGDLLCTDGRFMTSIVVTSPQDKGQPGKWMGRLIARMKDEPGQHFEAAIAVGASPTEWWSMGVSAVVRSDSGREVHDALIIFDLLASMSAPEMVGAFDSNDLHTVLGSPGDTLALAEGIWKSADDTFWIDPVIGQFSKGGETLVLVIATGFPRFKSFMELLQQIRQMIGEHGTVLFLWTEGTMERVCMSQQFIPFHVLIRSVPPRHNCLE